MAKAKTKNPADPGTRPKIGDEVIITKKGMGRYWGPDGASSIASDRGVLREDDHSSMPFKVDTRLNNGSVVQLWFYVEEIQATGQQATAPACQPAPGIQVGDPVQVKASVTTPLHGWGRVKHGDVGIVKSLDTMQGQGQGVWVDFEKQRGWHGRRYELELAAPPAVEPARDHVASDFAPGDRVEMVRDNPWAKAGEQGAVVGHLPDSDLDLCVIVMFDSPSRQFYTAARDLRHVAKTSSATEPPANEPASPAPYEVPYDRLAWMIKWEAGELDEDGTAVLFQDLITSGMAWRFGGDYAAQAQALIEAGKCHLSAMQA